MDATGEVEDMGGDPGNLHYASFCETTKFCTKCLIRRLASGMMIEVDGWILRSVS